MKGKFLLLGSNLGDKLENISRAKTLIGQKTGPIITSSSLYKTSSWGVAGQPYYYNQLVVIETGLNPQKLLASLLEIEISMGRIRKKKWDNRIIDIDILFYDDLVMDDESLNIPHPEIQHRRFALVPLAEIAPDEIHPVTGLKMIEMLKRTRDHETVIKLDLENPGE
jgi:2-amino-4-hydroxy-6-hydroxymethyldihydropteridine diphosphokinase